MEDTLFLLPVVAMVMAAEDIDLGAEPEEGEAGEKAQLLGALDNALKVKAATAQEAEEAAAAAQKASKDSVSSKFIRAPIL